MASAAENMVDLMDAPFKIKEESKVVQALFRGDIEGLRKILHADNVNTFTATNGWNLLSCAIYSGNVAVVDFLFSIHAQEEVMIWGPYQSLTSLSLAVKAGKPEMVKYFLNRGEEYSLRIWVESETQEGDDAEIAVGADEEAQTDAVPTDDDEDSQGMYEDEEDFYSIFIGGEYVDIKSLTTHPEVLDILGAADELMKLTHITDLEKNPKSQKELEALETRYAETLKQLLKRGASVHQVDADGDTPLHLCVKRGNFILARLLLQAGAKPSPRNGGGVTPLLLACIGEVTPEIHVKFIELLIEYGASLEERDEDKDSVMLYAAFEGNLPVLRLLHEKYKMNFLDQNVNGDTVLRNAVLSGHLETVKYICYRLAEGDLTNIKKLIADKHFALVGDKNECSAFFAAILDDDISIMRFFCEELDVKEYILTEIDQSGNNILMSAAGRQNPQLVSYLIQSGCNLELKNKSHHHALDIARAKNTNKEIIEILTAATGLMTLAKKQGVRFPASVEELLKKGASLTQRGNEGRTPLHMAAESNNVPVFLQLLACGASLEEKDAKGLTPLELAEKKSNPAIVVAALLQLAKKAIDKKNNQEAEYFVFRVVSCIAKENFDYTRDGLCLQLGAWLKNEAGHNIDAYQWLQRALSSLPNITGQAHLLLAELHLAKRIDVQQGTVRGLDEEDEIMHASSDHSSDQPDKKVEVESLSFVRLEKAMEHLLQAGQTPGASDYRVAVINMMFKGKDHRSYGKYGDPTALDGQLRLLRAHHESHMEIDKQQTKIEALETTLQEKKQELEALQLERSRMEGRIQAQENQLERLMREQRKGQKRSYAAMSSKPQLQSPAKSPQQAGHSQDSSFLSFGRIHHNPAGAQSAVSELSGGRTSHSVARETTALQAIEEAYKDCDPSMEGARAAGVQPHSPGREQSSAKRMKKQ